MMIGKILPKKLRHSYYYWKSKHAHWKKSIWCDCGLGYFADPVRIYEHKEAWYYNKIDKLCSLCMSDENQYHVCWNESAGIYCVNCRWLYNTDYIGLPPRGKKYKGEQGVSN